MVTGPTVDLKVSIELDSLHFALVDLPEVAQEWPTLDEGEWASWSQDWDQLMGALEVVLEPRYRAGTMLPDQKARYRELRQQLQDALPTLDRLQLSRPRITF